MKNPKIKYQFSIKSTDELDQLSHEELLRYIKDLQKNLVREAPPKHSGNSSIPTSKEIVPPKKKKKNQSLRKQGGKNGGQLGHVGVTLRQTQTPDEIKRIPYTLTACHQCGADLSDTLAELKEKRQVLDLDLRRTNQKITQYQSYTKICPVCGASNHDNAFPQEVSPNISYGENTLALVNYLSVVHYLSYARIVQALETLYGLHLSEGTVDSLIKKGGKRSQVALEHITAQLTQSPVLGIDETGARVNGHRNWHWVFQDARNTLIVHNVSRGAGVINETFPDGFKQSIVGHDNFSAYTQLESKGEQLCLAHKLRDLNYAIECEDTSVMKAIKTLLQEAMADHKLTLSPPERIHLKAQYEESLNHLLAQPAEPGSQTARQIASFTKAKEKIFTFLLDPAIPPDNNGSERAIRNIKVKTKVSGQFKSPQGADDYAALRSIIDTARKRGMNEFDVLRDIAGGKRVFGVG